MRNRGQVHDLLRVGLGQHCKAGLAARHYVGVVAEDVQRVRRDGACGNVEHARQQLACDLVHVRDHEQQTLRRGVGRGQRACRQRAVHGACGTRLGLHLNHLNGGAEDILAVSRRPLVDAVRHRAGRRDRVDARDLGKRIRHMCRSGVTVHGLHFSSHEIIPPCPVFRKC